MNKRMYAIIGVLGVLCLIWFTTVSMAPTVTEIPKSDVESIFDQANDRVYESPEIIEEINETESQDVQEEEYQTIELEPLKDERTLFVEEWAPRLDVYLSNSPMAGYGSTFAEASYDYGVDPRYSAAIACVESGKGANCFRSYNAWGWGNSSWSSWDDAITSHIIGLSRGYSYSVTQSDAQKYCPPNWEYWYQCVSSEMSKI